MEALNISVTTALVLEMKSGIDKSSACSSWIVQKLLQGIIFAFPQLEKLLGVSQLGKGFFLSLLSIVLRVFLTVLYPVACFEVLGFLRMKESYVTVLARNVTFLFNWLLIIFIYGNETFSNGRGGFAEIKVLVHELTKVQSTKQNFFMLLMCSFKAVILGLGTLRVNYGKYSYQMKPDSSFIEECLGITLLLPFAVMAVASNRIYIANVVTKNRLNQISCQMKAVSMKRYSNFDECTVEYRRLHDFFIDFHASNGNNLMAIIAFSAINIIFQVESFKLPSKIYFRPFRPTFCSRSSRDAFERAVHSSFRFFESIFHQLSFISSRLPSPSNPFTKSSTLSAQNSTSGYQTKLPPEPNHWKCFQSKSFTRASRSDFLAPRRLTTRCCAQ